jgi:hypothetical protein
VAISTNKKDRGCAPLLENAAPQSFTMATAKNGGFWVKVRIAGTTGEAREFSQARAITFAIARALGIEVGQA